MADETDCNKLLSLILDCSSNYIIDTVEKDKSIKFIAWAITPWHAHGIEAALKYLNSNEKKVDKGILIVFDHHQTGRALDNPQAFFKEELKVVYNIRNTSHNRLYFHWLRLIVLLMPVLCLFPKFRTVYVIGPERPDYSLIIPLLGRNPFIRFVFIRTEEGVASYMNTLEHFKYNSVDKTSVWHHLCSLRYWYIKRFFSFFDKIHIDATLFTWRKNGLQENDFIYPYFISALEQKTNGERMHFEPKTIILCTTAWSRMDIVDDNDLNVLVNVCENLKDKGYIVVLKLHPRNVYFRKLQTILGISVLNGNTSIESLLSQADNLPEAIISFSSTSLVSAKLFWNIKAICLSDLLDRNKVSAFYLKEVDSFKNVFYKDVYFPKNMLELNKIL